VTTDGTIRLRLRDLTTLDRWELAQALADSDPEFEERTVATGAHGDLTTLMLTVALSAVALRGLVIWISRNRRSGSFTREVEIIEPDGTVRRERVVVHLHSATTDAEVTRAVGEALRLDTSIIDEALGR
jgi:hypothetical protein